MSNHLADSSPSFPDDFNISSFENSHQVLLREYFQEKTVLNKFRIEDFNPRDGSSETRLDVSLGNYADLGDGERRFVQLLQKNMLTSLGIHVPEDVNDPRIIFSRHYAHEVDLYIWYEQFDHGAIPVSYRTVPHTKHQEIEQVSLLTYDFAMHQKEECEERSRLWKRMSQDMRMSAEEIIQYVGPSLRVDHMRWIVETFDDIHKS